MIGLEGIIEDITITKKTREEIANSELRFRAVWESTNEGMRLCDSSGNIIYVNQAFTDMVEMTRNNLENKNYSVIYKDQATAQRVEDLDAKFNKDISGVSFEKKIILWNSKTNWFEISYYFLKFENREPLLLSIFRNTTEKRNQLYELRKAKNLAEKSSQLKSEFLALMSHEIRTPLNVIISFNQLVKQELDNTLGEQLQYGFESTDRAGKRIIRTIELILNMSELQSGTYSPMNKELDLSDIIKGLIIELRNLRKPDVILTFDTKTEDTRITADDYSTTQIFANLIDNAIKYTIKGEIKITIERNRNNKLEVHVIDTGIGISKDYLPKLFSPFTQEESGYSRSYEGNGLGMALVKRYCEINNAEIKVKSQKQIGTHITVTFSE